MTNLSYELAKSKLEGVVRGIITKHHDSAICPEELNEILHRTNPQEAKSVNVVDKLLIICSTAKKMGACSRCTRRPMCKEHREG